MDPIQQGLHSIVECFDILDIRMDHANGHIAPRDACNVLLAGSVDTGHYYVICVVEGQGALSHPAYSGVSLGLLHGSAPDAMILCHRPGRTLHRHTDCPIPSLGWTIETHERLASAIHPARVAGVAVLCVSAQVCA